MHDLLTGDQFETPVKWSSIVSKPDEFTGNVPDPP